MVDGWSRLVECQLALFSRIESTAVSRVSTELGDYTKLVYGCSRCHARRDWRCWVEPDESFPGFLLATVPKKKKSLASNTFSLKKGVGSNIIKKLSTSLDHHTTTTAGRTSR